MYKFQATKWAHVNPPESAWFTVSKHRKLARAASAMLKALKAQRKRCGIGQWDCNYRIVTPSGEPMLLPMDLEELV